MWKNLVIVESPAKAKTIGKFLGDEYKVMSSYGHIRDLSKKAIDLQGDGPFEADYEIPDEKRALVEELRRAASQAQTVWLASDEDREGEAIAWHLAEVLGLDTHKTRRIVFHEITPEAIKNALANPRHIDLALVDAQQARRVLDRVVGFELSPVLWRKIKPQLSAGRVQSVAVRLITEREEEIKAFRPEPFWRVNARFEASGVPFAAELHRRLATRPQAERLLRSAATAQYTVADVATTPVKRQPTPPFTTSTLQQEASRRLGFSVTQTMRVAQKLYEDGMITYMRTDSLNLSSTAHAAIAAEVAKDYGERYYQRRNYHTKAKGAQEAHEAIRPTYMDRRAVEGTPQEQRLYQLIRTRTLASQMADAVIDRTTATITATPPLVTEEGAAEPAHFTATGEVVAFDGFLRVYGDKAPTASEGGAGEGGAGSEQLPRLVAGSHPALLEVTATERFTQQPPRYTEGSLVKKMEELGIGRPSTYAPTIATIQQRQYVEKGESEGTERAFTQLASTPAQPEPVARQRTEKVGSDRGRLVPTDIGQVVNTFLTEYFPDILDYNFTAQIEEKFDSIAEGELPWQKELHTFYRDFHPTVEHALNMRLEHKVGERALGTDPATGRPVSVKIGRFGPMIQIGGGEGDEAKPQFASLQKGQSVATITLEEALRLFAFPKSLGQYEDKEVSVGIGRFGPYVKHASKFVSIPKTQAPSELTLAQAVELIEAKRVADANKTILIYPAEEVLKAEGAPADATDIQVLRGRFGPYFTFRKTNYRLPKDTADPAALSVADLLALAAAQDASPKKKAPRKAKK